MVDVSEFEIGAETFGILPELLTSKFPAVEIYRSIRRAELTYRSTFYKCTQHDWKAYDWNGSLRAARAFPTQPLIGTSMPDTYIPLDQRRPRSPYRLAKVVVTSFTNLLFGHGCWPTITSEDPVTQDFAEACVKACKLKTKMIRARNIGGSCGTVGISWGFRNGLPVVRVHPGYNLYVLDWEDEDEFVPAHVVELYQYPKDEYDHKKRKYQRVMYWHRRDWTMNSDVEFKPVKVTDSNPEWEIDEENSVQHNHEKCHFVWLQNEPNDDESSIDGLSDYNELYEQLDSIDVMNSVSVKGTIANLDPTLKLKMERDDVGAAVVQKGSDNAIVTGLSGDASYLELSGASIAAGAAAIKAQRDQILEAANCIVTNPDQVAAGSVSSVALKVVYARMLSRGDVLRDQYGEGILRVLTGMVEYGRMLNVGQQTEEIEVDEYGVQLNAKIVENTLKLPPRLVRNEELDEFGDPTGRETIEQYQRTPGEGTLSLEWPSYFEETSEDLQNTVSSLNTATGGRAVMSQRTAVETVCKIIKRQPVEEMARIVEEQRKLAETQAAGMFPPTGGQVSGVNDLPPGATEDEESPDDQQATGSTDSAEERPE